MPIDLKYGSQLESIWHAWRLPKHTSKQGKLFLHSFVYPLSVIEDVLVNIDSLVIPYDFYILNMECDSSNTSTPILFGTPFLKTANN